MALQRTVDVIIKGKDAAGAAFASARGGVNAFEGQVKRMLSPLNLLKGAIAALGIASVGALFKKATTAAIEHEKGLGRNVETLGKLRQAWDFVMVTIGRAILGMGEGSSAVDMFTDGLVRFGNWIEENKKPIQDFVGLIGKLVGLLGMAARGLGAIGALVTGKGLEAAAKIAEGSGPADSSGAFARFQREQVRIKARKDAEERAKEIAKESIKTGETLEDLMRGHGAGTSFPVGVLGEGKTPTLQPIAEAVPALGEIAPQVTEGTVAFEELRESIDIGADSIIAFADTWAEATQEMIDGSLNLGQAILKAGRRAVGGVLLAKGRETLLDAGKAAIEGLKNPVEFIRAARLFAIGTAQTAAGQLFSGGSGGGGGGGGGIGSAGFSQQAQEVGARGTGKVIVRGPPLWDMRDPLAREALAAAITDLRDFRDIEIIFEGNS